MIRASQIPDEVVEAAAMADYENWRDMYAVRGDTLGWEDIEPELQEEHRESVRASIAAALNAWPGMRLDYWGEPDGAVLLPLPMENANAET